MEIIKKSIEATGFNVKPGDVISAGNKYILVTSIFVNDYRVAFVDLSNGATLLLRENGDNIKAINEHNIECVYDNAKFELHV